MKKILLIAFTVLLVAGAFFTLKAKEFYNAIHKQPNQKLVEIEQNTIYNIALFGYGGGNHDGTYLTDSIMVIHLDKVKKKALMISVPRDLWVALPQTSGPAYSTKINNAYQIGLFPDNYPGISKTIRDPKDPASVAKWALSQITGLPINHYVAVDFNGFIKTIDSLGGIDVEVSKTFDDYEYPIDGKEKDLCGKEDQFIQIEKYLAPTPPINEEEKKNFFKDKPELEKFLDDIKNDPVEAFPCRYEHLHFDKGIAHLDGKTALKFARSRHSIQDGTDFGRAARQQKVILAAKEKVLSITFLPKILPLMDDLKTDIQTDLSLNDIKTLLLEGNKSKEYAIKSMVISTDNYATIGTSADGQSIVMPKAGENNFSEIKQAVQDILFDRVTTPSATISP